MPLCSNDPRWVFEIEIFRPGGLCLWSPRVLFGGIQLMSQFLSRALGPPAKAPHNQLGKPCICDLYESPWLNMAFVTFLMFSGETREPEGGVLAAGWRLSLSAGCRQEWWQWVYVIAAEAWGPALL